MNSDERDSTLKEFKEGKFKVLVNVTILTTGFDFEELDCIIMARPTKSKILYIQCIGRGLRIAKGKDDCLILDIVDNCNKNNLVDMKFIFDIEDGENILEGKKRKAQEVHDKDLLKKEERKRIEAEQEKLRLEEINLFNRSIFNIKEISNLDWFFGKVNMIDVAILSSNSNEYYYVLKLDKDYNVFKYTKLYDYKYKLYLIDVNNNLIEIISSIDDRAIKQGSSFINKNSKWKKEAATIKQVNACKCLISTKWYAHKYFSKKNMYFALKNIVK